MKCVWHYCDKPAHYLVRMWLSIPRYQTCCVYHKEEVMTYLPSSRLVAEIGPDD